MFCSISSEMERTDCSFSHIPSESNAPKQELTVTVLPSLPHLRRQHLRSGTRWFPAAWGCPGPGCKASAGPTTSGSSRWLSRWWAAAGSPGWGWLATPGCTGCGEGPRSEAPVWRMLPPQRSRIPFQTWPSRGGWGGLASACGAPQLQTRHSPHCPCRHLWRQYSPRSSGAKKCRCVCQVLGPYRVGVSQTGPLIEGSWLRDGEEG